MSGIALLAEPLSAQDRAGLPIMVLGFLTGTNAVTLALLVDDEGRLRWQAVDLLRVDWRYDWEHHRWIEVNGVTNGAQDDAPDGGPSVP